MYQGVPCPQGRCWPVSLLGQLSGRPVAVLLGAHPHRGVSRSAQPLCSFLWVLQVVWVQASGLYPSAFPPQHSGVILALLLTHSPQHPPTHGGYTAHTTLQQGTFPSMRWGAAGGGGQCGSTFAAAASHFSPDCSAVGFPTSHSPFWVSSQSLPRQFFPVLQGCSPSATKNLLMISSASGMQVLDQLLVVYPKSLKKEYASYPFLHWNLILYTARMKLVISWS